MLVVHNDGGSGHRLGVIEPKPLRRFAFGSLLAYGDEVYGRVAGQRMLECSCLALPSGVSVYDKDQLRGILPPTKFDSVLCHLVLDHGGTMTDDFFETLRVDFLAPDGLLLNPVKTIAKDEVARASLFGLETDVAPCVIKKNDNYNLPETVLQISTQEELDAWRKSTPPEEQSRFVVHKKLSYFAKHQSGMHQLERWIVLFDDLTVNHRCSDEFYIKSATSLSYFARDERRMAGDLNRLVQSGYDWKGRSIDCAYDNDAEAWDARYAVLKHCREAFRFHYAELDVIRPSKNEFVVIDVNQTPGPWYRNEYFREVAVRILGEALEIRPRPAILWPEEVPEAEELGDPKILEEELGRTPDSASLTFRLARAYARTGQLEQALSSYKKRALMEKEPAEERFWAQLEAGRLSIRMGAPEAAIVGELLSAYLLRPQRAEPFHELARYHRLQKNYAAATLFAKAGAQTPRPRDRLSVAGKVYDWQLLDELGASAHMVGDYSCAKRSWETVLSRVQSGLSVPTEELKRIRENLVQAAQGLSGRPRTPPPIVEPH